MSRGLRRIIVPVAALLLAAGCTATPADPPGGQQQPLSVAVSFYPFAFIVERVGGGAVAVQNLTQPGAEPHDLELTPRQLAAVGGADLLVYQKGFQPAIDDALGSVTPKRIVDTASFLTLQPGEQHDHDGDPHDDDDAEGTPGAQPAGGAALDPHTWLDPQNLVQVTEQVRRALADARPEAADALAANANALVADLKRLDGEFRSGLARCKRTVFITSHAAFGYLASRYGLEQVGIRGLEPDLEPSAARIAAVREEAKEHRVTTIFFETLVSPVVAQSVADDLGLKTDVLDPLEGITEQSRGSDYLAVMTANLAALRTANDCA